MLVHPVPRGRHDKVPIPFDMPRPVTDVDVGQLQEWLQLGGLERLAKDTTHQAVDVRAYEHAYHPVRNYLTDLTWDGTPRLAGWLATYLGAEDTPYTEGIGRMFLVWHRQLDRRWSR